MNALYVETLFYFYLQNGAFINQRYNAYKNFKACNFINKETPTQVFSCEFC